MTHRHRHPPELDATGEIAPDFTSHLAERLQLAPDAVLEHLESWLVRYPRPERQLPGPAKGQARPSDLCVQAATG